MTIARTATISTPDGPFTVVVGDDALLASGWTDDVASLVALVHPSLRPASVVAAAADASDVLAAVPVPPGDADDASSATDGYADHEDDHGDHDHDILAAALAAVGAYYAGDLAAPGTVPVRQRSGEFREHAWDVLRGVGPGEALTYTQYAERAGRPAAVRAAAGACAMNAAALFVPCHRVLRTDGSLGGFRYGLLTKESLLTRERALVTDALF